jgi:hypothetical protein
MRIAMRYNAYATPCSPFAYGEVEDYTVNISGGHLSAAPLYQLQASPAIGQSGILQGSIMVYPQPASQTANIQLDARIEEQAIISLQNMQGQTVRTIRHTIHKGINNIRLDVYELPAAVYVLNIISKTLRYSTKLVVVK